MPLNKLTQRAKDVLLSLPDEENLTSGQILDALSSSSGMSSVLLQSFPQMKVDKSVDINVDALIKESFYQAIKLDHSYVGTEHILLALLKFTRSSDQNNVKDELVKMNVFPNAVKTIEKSKKTPLLESFGENINQKLLKDLNKPLLDREEYNTLITVLLQKNNSNALLIGEKGVGKKTVVELLAQNINYLDVPPALLGYQVIEFDLLGFMTNALNKSSMEAVLTSVAEEIKSLGRVIIYIKNFQNLFFATGVGFTVPMLYSMFKSSINSDEVKFTASMSTSLYEKIILENEHILEGFSVIEVAEPREDLTKNILKLNAQYLGQYHNVEIPADILNYVYKKAKDEIKDIKFPQKGLDLLDQACSRLILKKRVIPEKYKTLVDRTYLVAQSLDKSIESGDYNQALKTRKKLMRMEDTLVEEEKEIFSNSRIKLTPKEIDEALEEFGIEKPAPASDEGLSDLPGLSKKIKRKIIGQDEAVDTVVRSLVRAKLGLRSKKRPVGNFLFLGPTGVGKTELAKVLADNAFPHKGDSLIRLDMSDFAEKHNVARLVGAPPGYIGYGEGGELTSKIELQPESVVLFDEIEKAHPDVLNILLQLMEEGELKDAKGNTFDFSRAIIILTSNLGTEFIHSKGIGFDEKVIDDSNIETRLKANLKKILKPELLNRFDEVIVFRRLTAENQYKVLDVLVKELEANLLKQKVNLIVTEKARKYLLKAGYSEEYGARSLRRTVEKELLDKVAEVLLENHARPLDLRAKTKDGHVIIETWRK